MSAGMIRVGLVTYLASSLLLAALVRFLLGTGILHSMEKATQLVQGTLWRVSKSQVGSDFNPPKRCCITSDLPAVMLV